MVDTMDRSEIDRIMQGSMERAAEREANPAGLTDEDRAKAEPYFYRMGVRDGTIEPTWLDTSVGAVERGIVSVAKSIPGLWQQGARKIQEETRRGMYAVEKAMEGDYKNVLKMGIVKSNPAYSMMPTRLWPSSFKESYEEYKKKVPLALDNEELWTSKLFNLPADTIRSQSKKLFNQYPWMEGEPTSGFKDIITDPQKLLASVLESGPLMVGSGMAMAAGAPQVAFALMYGAEGNEAYEEAIADGRSKDEANEAFHIYGLSAAAVEMVQLGQYMKLGKGQYKAILGRMAKKVKKKTSVSGVKSLTKEWLKNQAMESVEEMTQGTLQEITAYGVYGKVPEGGLAGFVDRRATDAAVAFAMGLPFGGPAITSDIIQGGSYERSTEKVARDQKVMAEIREDVGMKEDDYAIPAKLSKGHAKLEDFVRRVFGKSVVWFEPNSEQSVANDFDGWAHPTDPSIIMLNANSPKPMQTTAFHESMHQLEVENPEGYKLLGELVSEHIKDKPALKQAIVSKLNRVGYEGSDDMVESELMADVIGTLAQDDAFLDRVAGVDPSILTSIQRTIARSSNLILKMFQSEAAKRAEDEMTDIAWVEPYIEEMDQLSVKIGNALERITRPQREIEAVKETEGVLAEEAVSEEEAELEVAEPEAPEKKEYTTISKQWHAVKTLSDWGRRGLRYTGEGRIAGRKFFDAAWLAQFSKLPTRLPKSTLKYLRQMTDEIFSVDNRNGENYWLVPTKALEEAKAKLPASAFERTAAKPRPVGNQINDVINSLEKQGMSPEEIGRVVEIMARDLKMPVEDLGERAYQLVYAGRGQEAPVERPKGVDAHQAYIEASRHPEMTQAKQAELRELVKKLTQRDKLVAKRRLTKPQKAKLATLPTYEQVMFEIDKFRPQAMEVRQKEEVAKREEKFKEPQKREPVKVQRDINARKGEESRQLAARKSVATTLMSAAGRYIFGYTMADLKFLADKYGWDTLTIRDKLLSGELTAEKNKNTQSSRRNLMKQFIPYVESQGAVDIQDVTPEMIRGFIKMRVKEGLKATSINQQVKMLIAMFDMFVREEIVGLSPFEAGDIQELKEGKRAQMTVTPATLQRVIDLIPTVDDAIGIRDIAIIRVLFGTGLRSSELMDTTVPGKQVQKYVKGKGGTERQVFLPPEAVAALDLYINTIRPTLKGAKTTPAVFLNQKGGPMSRESLYYLIKKRFKAAGVKLTTHQLRASFATDMLAKGMDIPTLANLLGHKQFTTTAKYLNITTESLKKVIADVEARVEEKKKKPKPSVSRLSRLGKVEQTLFAKKEQVLDLKNGLNIDEGMDSGGWVATDGSVYIAQSRVGGVLYNTHKADARQAGLSLLQVLKAGVTRIYNFETKAFSDVGIDTEINSLNAATMATLIKFTRTKTVEGETNTITLTLWDSKRKMTGYAKVVYKRRLDAESAVRDAVASAKLSLSAVKPMPSVARKSRRIYTRKPPKGRILDTADRVAGRRAQAHIREVSEEEMLRVRLRAEREVGRRAFKEGAQAYREKLGVLKATIKKTKALKKEMLDFVREKLPVGMRGKMVTAIEKIKDEETFEDAAFRLDDILKTMEKRGSLARLRKFQKVFNKKYANKRKALYKEGGKFRLAPEVSAIFEKIFGRITTKGKLPSKYAQLEEMLDYARTERAGAEREAAGRGEDVNNPYVTHEIDKTIESLEAELAKIPIKEWTPEQIDALTDGMIVLMAAHEWSRSDYKAAWDLDRNTDVTYSVAEVKSGWKKPKEDQPRDIQNATSHYRVRNVMSFVKGLFGRNNYNLQTLVQVISGAKKGVLFERLVRDIQASVDDTKYEMFYMQDQFQEMLKFAGISWGDLMEWTRLARVRKEKLPTKVEQSIEKLVPEYLRPKIARRDVLELKVVLESGKVFEGTVMEFIDVLMHLRNEFNYSILKEHGGVFKDREYNNLKMTDADFAIIRKAVPKKALKLVTAMDTLVQIQQGRINEVSRRIDGFDIANVSGYWHIRRQLADAGVKGKEAQYSYETIEGRSNWKQRLGGKQPLILGDAFNNLLETLQVGAEYIGMTESMRNARFLTRNRTLKKNIVERGYGDYWTDIIKQLNRLQEQKNVQQWYEQFYGWMARGVTRAVFGFNLRVSAQQYASVFLAASELGFGALKFVRGKPSAAVIRRASKWSPMIRERFLGAIGRELGDVAKVGSVMRFLTNQDQMINLPTFLVRLFDKMAITDVWRMAEGTMAERYGVPLAELLEDAEIEDVKKRKWPKFEYDVTRLAEETIRTTQPTWHIVDRSVIGSDKNPLVRALTMFHSQREKLAQMIGLSNSRMMNDLERIRIQYGLKTLREAATTKEGVRAIGKMAQTYGIVLTNTAMVKAWAIMYGITMFDRDDDIADWATAVVADIPGMYYFGDIPRDVVVAWGKKARGKRVYQLGAYESPPIRVVSTARLAAYEMGNLVMMTMGTEFVSDKDVAKQLDRTLDATWESVNYAMGLPFLHGTSIFNAMKPKPKGKKK